MDPNESIVPRNAPGDLEMQRNDEPYGVIDAYLEENPQQEQFLQSEIEKTPELKNMLQTAAYNQAKQVELIKHIVSASQGNQVNVVINNNFYLDQSTKNINKSRNQHTTSTTTNNDEETILKALTYLAFILTLIAIGIGYIDHWDHEQTKPQIENSEHTRE